MENWAWDKRQGGRYFERQKLVYGKILFDSLHLFLQYEVLIDLKEHLYAANRNLKEKSAVAEHM